MFPNLIIANNTDNDVVTAYGPYNQEDASMLVQSMQHLGHYDPVLWIDLGTRSMYEVIGDKTVEPGNYQVALRDFANTLDQAIKDMNDKVEEDFHASTFTYSEARYYRNGYQQALRDVAARMFGVQAELAEKCKVTEITSV